MKLFFQFLLSLQVMNEKIEFTIVLNVSVLFNKYYMSIEFIH